MFRFINAFSTPAQLIKLTIPNAVEKYLKNYPPTITPPCLNRSNQTPTLTARQTISQIVHATISYQATLRNGFTPGNWKRSTIDGVLAKIGPFFNWCIRENYCDNNPCKTVKRPRSDDSPPSIFTPPETRKLLRTAFVNDRGLIPYLAIGLFAGVRPLEIQRLQKQDINDLYIEIKASKTKTRKRRLVSLSNNLKAWLRLGGDLPPNNKPKRLSRILEKARLKWKPDIMRHSYASYHLAFHQSADKTALEMGHRDTQMLFRHYRELVTKEEAQAYWSIEP